MLRRRLMLRLRLGLGSGSGLGSGLGLSEPVPLQQVVRWPSQTPRPAGSGCRLVRGGSSVGWKLVHRVACCAPRKAVGHMGLRFAARSEVHCCCEVRKKGWLLISAKTQVLPAVYMRSCCPVLSRVASPLQNCMELQHLRSPTTKTITKTN